MNVGAHLETFSVRVNIEDGSFLCLIAHKWLSGQPLSSVQREGLTCSKCTHYAGSN